MFDENIRAELIYDGTDEVRVPSTMEDPGPGQMVGTAHERLGEVSCRICYESMGVDPITGKPKGRSSAKLHEHIKQVKNHSVYEHCAFTVTITGVVTHFLPLVFINRPGIWYQEVDYNNAELTINHRSIIEWASWTEACSPASSVRSIEKILGEKLYQYARLLAPSLYEEKQESEMALSSNLKVIEKKDNFTLDQAWVSLYLSGSRGFSHEQVRHGDFTAISQRSSRFCDETESPYVMHPLVTHFIQDHEADPFEKRGVIQWTNNSQITDQKCYLLVVDTLQNYLKKKGVEGTTARKQARGAARGYLGNALFTDMIFSANARQWRWIVSQRASAPADAEIRNLYAPHVLQALQSSRYGYFFDDMQLAPSPDGIGQIVIPTP